MRAGTFLPLLIASLFPAKNEKYILYNLKLVST